MIIQIITLLKKSKNTFPPGAGYKNVNNLLLPVIVFVIDTVWEKNKNYTRLLL